MGQLVFGRWGKELFDQRAGAEVAAKEKSDLFPPDWAFADDVVAIMCGKGFLVLNEEFRFVPMMREYVSQIQAKYCCGKCLTGIKGTRMLLLTLDKICAGDADTGDLDLLERVGTILDDAAKCSVCQSAGELVKDGLKYFRDEFVGAVASGVPSDSMTFSAKISAPCMTTCPCHINIPMYVEMLQEVRYAESLSIIRQNMPVPGVTGRVCPAPCEKACTLANMGKPPVPIKILKRVAADYEMLNQLEPPLKKPELNGEPVAVVGAGPAGLSAAFYLNQLGHEVTIFEALRVTGGMVGVGIPPYRQPRDVLDRDIGIILNLGVKLEQEMRLGQHFSIQDLFDRGFKAVFLGIGSHRSLSMGIKGENEGIKGVFPGGIDLLRNLNLGKRVTIGNKVVIVGGGNTAIDCARTCLRLGADEVHIVYRRTEKQMPADPLEVEDSMEEGIQFHFLTQPLEILATDKKQMIGLKCIQMQLGEPDKSGRRRPVPVEGSEFDMEADTLIPAIGQQANLDFLTPADHLEVTRWGTVKVDKTTMMTTRPGVFAAGDAVSGPLTVVHGVAGGKLAADKIHEYLTTGRCTPSKELRMEEILALVEKQGEVRVTPRIESREGGTIPPKKLDMRERITTFQEVEAGLTQAGSYVESSRCLRCFHLVLAAVRES